MNRLLRIGSLVWCGWTLRRFVVAELERQKAIQELREVGASFKVLTTAFRGAA